MKKFKLVVLSLTASFGFIGCASVEKISMKDGKPLYQSTCRGNTSECHVLASKQCSGSYEIIETSGNLTQRFIIFQCK
ncbi:hypothetical protein UFOVP610_17 [uncultured Caudovirales phage]|uniref:Lipoprotein n=1 Tax=uncultured Caudovirales phage TaxID=2100421 RepID=A0A6J5N5N2_9CAUD|nr:hypothetical protein UFOVP610_17 [uncultured Caudovirales phage]